MKAQIESLLSRGLPATVVANAVGCTESYISQLLAEEEFASRIAAKKLLLVEKESNRSTLVNEIRDELLAKTRKALPLMLRPQEILSALKIIDGLKCAIPESDALKQQTVISQVVQVNLPTIVQQQFLRNGQNEIIEVEGRSLATLTPVALKNLLSSRTQAPEEKQQNGQLAKQDHRAVKTAPDDPTAAAFSTQAEAA